MIYQKYFKRFFDILLSLILLFFLFPIMIIIFFIVWIKIGFPIFSQRRPGLNGKIFIFYKFKTLYDSPDNISEKKRQNSLGNILRKTGLDELPQLFNVLANTMSLVGPRPLLEEYLKKYSNYEKKRHLVKPGITGLAQTNGYRGEIENERDIIYRVKYDIFYLEKWSLLLDLKVIFLTVLNAIKGDKKAY